MAKFYQHMQPGETLGKITRLKYIDDISDDELIIYVFEDKSKCSEGYIAEVNSTEAFNGNYVMVELTDPLNCWKFETKEINLNKTRTVVGDDGLQYELPEPGIGINGEHVSLGLTQDGNPIASGANMLNGKRTDATPPRIIKNKQVEPKENYLLSLHPELLYDKSSNESLLSDTLNMKNKSNKVNKNNFIENTTSNKSTVPVENKIFKKSNPITTNIVETIKHASITINLDDIVNNQEYDNIHIILNGKQEDLTIEEFINKLTYIETPLKEIEETTVIDVHHDEDILITNMIDRSKKKECTIGVDINLELPPKEVYQTIKNVYPDGMAENFVLSIAKRMNINTLKEALAMGLTSYYEMQETK